MYSGVVTVVSLPFKIRILIPSIQLLCYPDKKQNTNLRLSHRKQKRPGGSLTQPDPTQRRVIIFVLNHRHFVEITGRSF